MVRRRKPPRPGALADLSPLRILTQIAMLQLAYYAVAIVLIVFTAFVAGQSPDLAMLLDWHSLRGDVTTGWTLALCWMLDSLITVIPILLLIARSKLVLDFALTIHLINFFVTSFYTRAIPNTLYWWLVQMASAALMTSLGMWACQWRELQPFQFGGHKKQSKSTTNGEPSDPSTLEEGGGFEMGSGRGKGRDGAGAYEMVEMAPREPA